MLQVLNYDFLFQLYKKLCCKKPAPPRPEFSIVCVGLESVGKSTILCLLAHERTDNIQPTTGTPYRLTCLFFNKLIADLAFCMNICY